jgi:hypothetical protein
MLFSVDTNSKKMSDEVSKRGEVGVSTFTNNVYS